MRNPKNKFKKCLLYNLCFIMYLLLTGLMVNKDCLASDGSFNGFRFRVKNSLSIDVDNNQKLNKKDYGEDNSTLYEISGLLSNNIIIKVFKDNKLIMSNNLVLINKTHDGDLYLYEKTGAGFINLWTIFPKLNIVICNKQYISISIPKNIELKQYINIIESYF